MTQQTLKRTMPAGAHTGWSVLLSVGILGACSSTAPYQVPFLDVDHVTTLPSAVQADALGAAAQPGVPPALWWMHWGDAQLATLIQLAWINNYDLRVSVARLAAARAQSQVAQATGRPGIMLEGGASHTRQAAVESRSGTAGIADPQQWSATLAWELDLFGRARSSVDAAQASAQERAALRDDVRRLALAQVVDAYLALRGAQMLRTSLLQQLDNQASTLQLVREREGAGSAAPAERLRYEAQLGLVRARLPSFLAQERAARNRLATLTGLRLDAPQLVALGQPTILQLPQTLVTDEPARLLLRRPDVRAAERALAAATARAGMAQADLFPRVSLSALLGNAGVVGDWLSSDTTRWRAEAGLMWPLFDAGAGRARLRAAGADVQAARANFDKAVAQALEETDTAISNWVQLRTRHAELVTAHGMAQEGERLTHLRYQEGAESLLGVLEAQRIALATEEQLVGAQRDLGLATAQCYVAMAGGFDVGEADAKPRAP